MGLLAEAEATGDTILIHGRPTLAAEAASSPWPAQIRRADGTLDNVCKDCGRVINRFFPGTPTGRLVSNAAHNLHCSSRDYVLRASRPPEMVT